MWVIWSFEHNAWWAAHEAGFVTSLSEAGRYTQEDAGRIVTDSILVDEVAVYETIAQRLGAPRCHPYCNDPKLPESNGE